MSTSEHTREKLADLRRSFGAYRLLRIISEGATGVVIEAEHYHLGRRVALKTVNPKAFERTGMDEREVTAQFIREGRILAAVDHHNVLAIHEAGFARCNGIKMEVPYLAMQLIGDGDLSSWVTNRGPLDNASAIKVFMGCVLGLQALHAAGFLHCDMKPDNILLAPDWRPLIADLGAASAKGLPPRPGKIVGTSGFLAPEHIHSGISNEATDIYGLGATMYFALTGKAPYQVDPQDLVVWAETANSSPEAHQERSSVDVHLSQVIHRTLQPLPENRYLNLAELIEDCIALTNGKKPGNASRSRRSTFWGKGKP